MVFEGEHLLIDKSYLLKFCWKGQSVNFGYFQEVRKNDHFSGAV